MSTFHKLLITLSIWVGLLVTVLFVIEFRFEATRYAITTFLIFPIFWIWMIFSDIDYVLTFKYRIKVINEEGTISYLPQVLRTIIFVIPY